MGVEISFKDICILAAVLTVHVDAEVSLGLTFRFKHVMAVNIWVGVGLQDWRRG